jgi:hypothetical protein
MHVVTRNSGTKGETLPVVMRLTEMKSMRVRPLRIADRPRAAPPGRAGESRSATPPPPVRAVQATPTPEHRWRDAGAPADRAQYTCGCGYVFDAKVSTSVACPHCLAEQAW